LYLSTDHCPCSVFPSRSTASWKQHYQASWFKQQCIQLELGGMRLKFQMGHGLSWALCHWP
jgi:hypothetical protein